MSTIGNAVKLIKIRSLFRNVSGQRGTKIRSGSDLGIVTIKILTTSSSTTQSKILSSEELDMQSPIVFVMGRCHIAQCLNALTAITKLSTTITRTIRSGGQSWLYAMLATRLGIHSMNDHPDSWLSLLALI